MTASIRCSQCHGVQLEGDHCLAHLSGPEFARALDRLRDGEPLDAREVQITAETLKELLDHLRADDQRPQISCASFENALFVDGATSFDRTHFLGDAHFDGAQFLRDAHFDEAQFSADAHFDGAQFSRDAHFDGTNFSGEADFRKAQFLGEADFRRVVAKRGRFREAQFFGDARFDRAVFSGDLDLRAGFRRRTSMGRIGVTGSLVFDNAVFDEDLRLDATAHVLSCVSTRFSGRADLNVSFADVTLEDATFAYMSRLAGVQTPSSVHAVVQQGWAVEQPRESEEGLGGIQNVPATPRLISLRRASVQDLHIAHFDLRACRFADARSLETIHLDPESVIFGLTPRRVGRTARRVVAEEAIWRRSQGEDDWISPATQAPEWAPREDVPTPAQVSRIYRRLRFACERSGEPAEDFYYGEMEMRRHDASGPGRAGIVFSWLTDGYGLKPFRAVYILVAFAVLVGVLFDIAGFDSPQSVERSLLHGFERTTAVIPGVPERDLALTNLGILIDIVARLVGAFLIGLTGFLSIQQRRRGN